MKEIKVVLFCFVLFCFFLFVCLFVCLFVFRNLWNWIFVVSRWLTARVHPCVSLFPFSSQRLALGRKEDPLLSTHVLSANWWIQFQRRKKEKRKRKRALNRQIRTQNQNQKKQRQRHKIGRRLHLLRPPRDSNIEDWPEESIQDREIP